MMSALVMWACGGTAVAAGDSSGWLYRAWLTDDGLPDNCVTGVAQTGDGYLWVGTLGGLLRFNGVDFTAMPVPEVPGGTNRVVLGMILDREGRMWLEMDRGPVVCLGPDGARAYGQADGLPDYRATAMAEDREGGIWIAYSNILCRIKDGRCKTFKEAEGFARGGGNPSLARDAKGEVWFANGLRVGVCRDGALLEKWTMESGPVRIAAAEASGLWICAGNRILKYAEGREPEAHGHLPGKAEARVMMNDSSGALWIGTAADGLFRLKDGVLESAPTSHQEVDCLVEDRMGNLWAGTNGGGLNQIRPRTVALIGREAGLPSESVRSVCQDAEGAFWTTCQNGMLARNRSGTWQVLTNADGWLGRSATCVEADGLGGVWIGTRNDGLHYLRNGQWRSWSRRDGLASNSVRSILVARNGDVWVATDDPRRLQQIRDGKPETLAMPGEVRPIRAMAETADGTVWIGTSDGQVLRVAGRRLIRELAAAETSPGSIRALHATPDGSLWIGYAGFGIGRLKDGNYARITAKEGLRDDYVSQMVSDDRGSMWVAGNRGLFQVRLSELHDVAEGRAERVRSRVFGRGEGLAGLQPSFDGYPAVCRSRDGRLWFAMRTGLLMVRPDKVRGNPEPPPVVMERVSVDDQTVAHYADRFSLQNAAGGRWLDLSVPAPVLRLAPGHRKVEFEFAALSFASPENNHFRYRLNGFDKKWIEAGAAPSVAYPRLPAGAYEFRVIACNNAGVWNETGAAVSFAVPPFFWQTWWFRSLALTVFTLGVIAIVRYVSFRRLRERMWQLEQQATLHRERARIARDMHDEVGAKLTRLSLLSEMASGQPGLPPVAKTDVKEISDTARETILAFEEIVWAVNPHNDTLGDLAHYLCRHAEEFFDGSSTQCVFDLPKVIPSEMLPTELRHQVFLAAKEALNNVMKHARASQVKVGLTLHPGAFELVIHDDGCGFDPAAPNQRAGGGNGLRNMEERIRGIGGRFECTSEPGHGTRVSFHVPTP
jgi:signal transduction histidine kinase/ligand-binding sensor domain-containing protein